MYMHLTTQPQIDEAKLTKMKEIDNSTIIVNFNTAV